MELLRDLAVMTVLLVGLVAIAFGSFLLGDTGRLPRAAYEGSLPRLEGLVLGGLLAVALVVVLTLGRPAAGTVLVVGGAGFLGARRGVLARRARLAHEQGDRPELFEGG